MTVGELRDWLNENDLPAHMQIMFYAGPPDRAVYPILKEDLQLTDVAFYKHAENECVFAAEVDEENCEKVAFEEAVVLLVVA